MKKMLTIMMSLLLVSVMIGCNNADAESNSGLNIGTPNVSTEEVAKTTSDKTDYSYEDGIVDECKKIGDAKLGDWKLDTNGDFTVYLSGNYETTKGKTDELVKYLSNSSKKHNTILILVSNYGVQQTPIYIK